MPKAVATQETYRRELKSVPDGFVSLRKLNYGEVLARREMAQQFDVSETEGGKPQGSIKVSQKGVAILEFSKSIVDHNLDDADDRRLNFNDPQDILKLAPEVAQEIERLINELNEFDLTEQDKAKRDLPLSSTSEKPFEPTVATLPSVQKQP